MFQKMRNIETAFQMTKTIFWVIVPASILIAAIAVVYSVRVSARSKDVIYLLNQGKILEAYASDRKENIPAEARDHVRTFHELFFTLSPDEKGIQENIRRALYLADASVRRAYLDLRENGFYSGIISGNIVQTIVVDSIGLETGSYPFHFTCMATVHTARPSSTVTSALVTEGWLRETVRSDNVPHGMLIEKWKVVQRKDLKIEDR